VALCKEQEHHKSDMQSLDQLETTRAKLKDTQAQLDDARAQLNDAQSQQKSEDYTAILRALCGDLEAKETKHKLTRATLEKKVAELKSVREELESKKPRLAELGSIHTEFEAARAKLEALHKEL
jgi:DNA repair exonuclease SbcCD ATPase subunit